MNDPSSMPEWVMFHGINSSLGLRVTLVVATGKFQLVVLIIIIIVIII